MCETSTTIGKISEALAKAQAIMKPAVFDSTNPHFKSKYATLASIMEACRPALSANGIAIIQGTSVKEGRVEVVTILTHAVSGEWVKDTLSIKPARDDAQGIGSALTYARRYALAALVGIVSEEDDDAEAAVGRTTTPATITPIRKVQEKSKAETLKADANKPVPENKKVTDKNPTSVAEAPKDRAKSGTLPVEQIKPGNPRVAKIREVFQLSARIGHSPEEMKAEIGRIIGLGRPIKESSEIKDDQLQEVLESFRKTLDNMQKSVKEAA